MLLTHRNLSHIHINLLFFSHLLTHSSIQGNLSYTDSLFSYRIRLSYTNTDNNLSFSTLISSFSPSFYTHHMPRFIESSLPHLHTNPKSGEHLSTQTRITISLYTDTHLTIRCIFRFIEISLSLTHIQSLTLSIYFSNYLINSRLQTQENSSPHNFLYL